MKEQLNNQVSVEEMNYSNQLDSLLKEVKEIGNEYFNSQDELAHLIHDCDINDVEIIKKQQYLQDLGNDLLEKIASRQQEISNITNNYIKNLAAKN